MRHRTAFFAVLAFTASAAFALDYGLSVSETPKYLYEDFSSTTSVSPWFSTLLGESAELYFSGIVDEVYEDEEWSTRLDFGRSQVTFRPRSGVRLDAGRFSYSDVSGFAAHGLFDGARVSYSFPKVNFLVGGFYTGLLNKERADIVMSDADSSDSFDDDVYFAPRRAFFTATVQAPSFFNRYTASAEALGQLDLRGGEEVVHTQYLGVSFSGPITSSLVFLTTLTSGMVEQADTNIGAIFAFKSELSFYPSGGPADRAYLDFKWASGDAGSLDGFLPVKGINAGTVFEVSQSGVATFKGGYFARLMDPLSIDLSASFFLRQGNSVVDAELDPESDGVYLGSELYGEAVFVPSSELSLFCGAGLFSPGSAAFVSSAKLRPLLTASLVISF